VEVNLKDDLLLAKEYYGLTAWNNAAWNGKREILEKLWFWGREVQTNLKDSLLLAKGRNGELPGTEQHSVARKRFYRHCGFGVEKSK